MRKLLFIPFLFFSFWSCQNEPDNTEDGVFKIVTTTGMLGDITKAIVKDNAEVVSLMGPGVDPHLYKATQGDLKLLRQADLVIYNGLHLEGKMVEILEKLANFPNKKVVAAAEVIHVEHLIISDQKNQVYDPHIWFDVELWAGTIAPILEVIINLDPYNKEFYQANAKQKAEELRALDQWAITQIQEIPEEQRVLITAHDAFAYFGRAYDIEVKGLQGISTLSEAGIKDVTALVNEIAENKIKAVFVESSVPKKSLEAVVQGVKEQGHDVVIGGTLYSDAMGEEGTVEGTYDGMVRHNISTIVKALK